MYKMNVRLSQNLKKKKQKILSSIYYEIDKIQNRANHYFITRYKIYNGITWIYS